MPRKYQHKNGPRTDHITAFWRKVQKDPDGCWIWTGAKKADNGVAIVNIFGRTQIAARVVYRLEVGPIGEGLFVCHHCDNRLCVRPDHLFLGTNRDNIDDAIGKGRLAFGRRKPKRLSTVDVASIAARLRAGASKHQLAREYGIDRSAIRYHELKGRFG